MDLKDKELLEKVLDTLREMRAWVNADYYRERVMPVVQEIKDRLFYVQAEELKRKKKKDPLDIDTIPSRFLDEGA